MAPVGSGTTASPRPHPQGSSGLKENVLKMQSLIDQCDESELMPPEAKDVNRWWQNYIAIMGAAPEESEEPTSSQVASLAKRVLTNNQAPYCDFAIWLPFGRRTSKTQKTRTYTPMGDGSFLYRDIPGPGSFQAWTCSWKVFKWAALMLNIVNLAALELYFRHIEKLVIQYPQCWSLIYTAEDTARAERLEKIRRHLDIEGGRGQQVEDWDPLNPWSCVFRELVKDATFWAERVHHPAAA